MFCDVQEKQQEPTNQVVDGTARAAIEDDSQGPSDQPAVAGTVFVLAIGKKEGSILRIGDKRVEL